MSVDNNARKLKNDLYRERLLLDVARKMRHYVVFKGEKNEFSASRFIYSFVAFDALYSINWDASLRTPADKRKYSRSVREELQQEQFIKFCFMSSDFSEIYKPYFLEYVARSEIVSTDIISALENIHIPQKAAQKKNQFLEDFKAFISGAGFNAHVVKSITDFIYSSVRCNLFHGEKFCDDLMHRGQQERFNIYSSFIIGLCQMGLSYLDFRINPAGIIQNIEQELKPIEE